MTTGQLIRQLRQDKGYSQEELAGKLNVSRQAITKWETDNGLPDVENLKALSTLFHISMDDLLNHDYKPEKLRYESMTEYDIRDLKRYDIDLGSLKSVSIESVDTEKLKVRITSDTVDTLEKDYKISIDDTKNRIDIKLHTTHSTIAKDEVSIMIELPETYTRHIELDVNSNNVSLKNIHCEDLELGGKYKDITISGFKGHLSIDTNNDMNIKTDVFEGYIEVNQINSISHMTIDPTQIYDIKQRGIKTKLHSSRHQESENIIELNGIKSELTLH